MGRFTSVTRLLEGIADSVNASAWFCRRRLAADRMPDRCRCAVLISVILLAVIYTPSKVRYYEATLHQR